LCEALFLANYIDKAGTGILDVLSKCKEAGLPIPEFAQDGDQFVVTLWRDWLTQDAIAKLGLTDRQLSVIPHLKANQRITNAQYRKITGVTDRTALRDLEDLVSKGVVVKSGKTGRGAGYLFVGKPDKNPTKPTNRGRK
jgi:predicted HTH transcriptional regulator